MKLKVAVVAGPGNAGKSYALKEFARSIYGKLTNSKVERPWDEGTVSINDTTNGKGKTLDFILVGEYKGKKVVILTEGDYGWEYIYIVKIIELQFKNENDKKENDEILVFGACKWSYSRDARAAKARDLELKDMNFLNNSFKVLALQKPESNENTEQVIVPIKKELLEIWKEWTGDSAEE